MLLLIMKVILILMSLFYTLTTWSKCDHMIRVGYESYPPFIYTDKENKPISGLDYELAQLIAKDTGCKIQFTFMPWKRLLIETESGNNDLVFAAIPTEKRLKWSEPSASYVNNQTALYINKNFQKKFKIKNETDLNSYKEKVVVGVAAGWVYTDEVRAWIGQMKNITHLHTPENIIRLLHLNRIEIGVLNVVPTQLYLQKNPEFSNIELLPSSFRDSKYSVLISKKTNSELKNLIFQSINNIILTKDYQSLLHKYHLSLD